MLTRTAETTAPIEVAHVAPFRLGTLEIHPATRQLMTDGTYETIEPRVMQVLVALTRLEGAVVTREELTDLCWDGRIVSKNAINRVVSRVRQIAAAFGQGSFELETIMKVGYRIVVATQDGPSQAILATMARPPASPPQARPVPPSRRLIVGAGIGAAVAALAGGGYWFRPGGYRHEPTPAAAELFRRGTLAQRQGLPDQTRQAVSFFEQATTTDPLYAEAWGALALAYRHILEGFGEAEQASLPDLIRSAAARALALDPDNADARLALLIIEPYYRNWSRQEAALRVLTDRHPGNGCCRPSLALSYRMSGGPRKA